MRFRLLLLAAFACTTSKPDDVGVTTGGTTGTTGTTGDAGVTTSASSPTGDPPAPPCIHDATDDCCCFTYEALPPDDGNYIDLEFHNTCDGSPTLCPMAVIICDNDQDGCPLPYGGDGNPDDFYADQLILDCILTALRDGTPGRLTWRFTTPGTTPKYVDEHLIDTDRRSFTYRADYVSDTIDFSDLTHQPLRPADYFADCLAAPDLQTHAFCLTSVTTGEILTTCLPGLGGGQQP